MWLFSVSHFTSAGYIPLFRLLDETHILTNTLNPEMLRRDKTSPPSELADDFGGRIIIFHRDTAKSMFTETDCCPPVKADTLLELLKSDLVTPALRSHFGPTLNQIA